MQDNILVLGNATMDFTMQVRKMPAAGESTVEDNRFGYAAGGSGALAALTVARLGQTAVFAGRVGDDVHGARLLHLYQEAGVDTSCMTLDRRFPTAMRVVIEEDNGSSRAMFHPGAGGNMVAQEAERAIAACRPSAIYLPFDIADDVIIAVSRAAESQGIPVFADAKGMGDHFPCSALGGFEIFVASAQEAQMLTGTLPIGSDSCLKATVALEKKIKAKYYILKLGDRGIFVYDGRYCHMVPGMTVRGAEGRSMNEAVGVALCIEYCLCDDIQAACRFGIALNALLQKNSTDKNYFPTANEVRALAAKQ